ncbi:hypothetical protein T4D_10022 [Trichinella pseudospiralis]|uniref:Uncharacterized protein n=1 Tax=Trichinella pseudospiralis TaxID=6337 RepID=A0A0V1FC08_TRIPS|nr:hypothetical protein T4D_10022 [Trichinella pseudospiralis]
MRTLEAKMTKKISILYVYIRMFLVLSEMKAKRLQLCRKRTDFYMLTLGCFFFDGNESKNSK